MDAAAKPGRLRRHDRLKVTEVSSAAVAAFLAVILRSVFCDEGSPSCPDFNTEARVCTYMPSHPRVIMHRFRLKTRRQSGWEGVAMHHAVGQALQIPVDTTREILITASAIRNRRNSIKTKVRHGF
jgi:hypothetical protein